MTYDQWKTESGYAEKTPEQGNEGRDCPVCNGDCAGANPPVYFCPMKDKEMSDAIEQIMEAREKRAEALHDMILEAREIVRVKLNPASPEEERGLYDKLQAALYTLRGDPFDMHMRAELLSLRRKVEETTPVVSVKTMQLSDGRSDYFVSFKCADREVTPHVFRERFKAEYHVALYRWLFGLEPEQPSVVDFKADDWPARALAGDRP